MTTTDTLDLDAIEALVAAHPGLCESGVDPDMGFYISYPINAAGDNAGIWVENLSPEQVEVFDAILVKANAVPALVAEVRRLRAARPDRDELLAELRAYHIPADTEEQHYAADVALLRYIDDDEIHAAFTAIKRWYA